MLRNLTLVAMVCFGVCALSGTSEASSPENQSFKVEASDGTEAGIAFGDNFFGIGPVLVHTPEGDFNGTYQDFFGIVCFAFANDNGYIGGFVAFVRDGNPETIQGTLIGSTGIFDFVGAAKN